MKTIASLEKDIIQITTRIHRDFPELSKYLNEMPVKIANNYGEAINIQNLEEYLNTLMDLLSTYSKTHLDKE
ncbi:MAG: hypothetical protein WAU01_06710 [Saprospiraceae bacterium]